MKKRIIKSLLVCLVMLSLLLVSSCNKKEDAVTRVTIDINPSIEFIVAEDNKVVSVTALNDDGSILIVGEVFIGQTIEEATKEVIRLATQMGYLIEGQIDEVENHIKISVSGVKKHAEDMYQDIEKEVNKFLKEVNIQGHIEKVDALNREALIKLAEELSDYSQEELQEMTEEELYKIIEISRIETALLLTSDMREAYYRAKEYEISFAEKEATAKIIEAMGGVYNLIYTGYQMGLQVYSEAIQNLDDFRYEMFVSPDSEYQKSLISLREAKAEFLKQRSYTYKLNVNTEEYISATVTLQMKEETYNKLLETYEHLGVKINESLEKIIETLRLAENALRELENKFSDDIKVELEKNVEVLEQKINEAKNNFFTNFENAHQEDIKQIEESLKKQKQDLIDSLNK